MKRSKNVWTAVITALFVLSISYFALLAPTTAWYYQEYSTQHLFQFGNFAVEEDDGYPQVWDGVTWTTDMNDAVNLRAATRFADKGEYLFSEVAQIVKVATVNHGNVPADVTVAVKQVTIDNQTNEESLTAIPAWLKYFVYDTDSGTVISSPNMTASTDELKKGTIKNEIEAMLAAGGITVSDYKDLASGSNDPEATYEAYNTTAKTRLDSFNQRKIHFEPYVQGSTMNTRDIYIIFWAEYGDVLSTYPGFTAVNDTSTPVVRTPEVPVRITMTARPYLPSLTIKNDGTQSASVSIAVGGGTATSVTIPAGSYRDYTNLDVGTHYTVTLSSGNSLQFNDTYSDGTVSPNEAQGSITNVGNTVTISNSRTLTVQNTGVTAANLTMQIASANYTGPYVLVNAQNNEYNYGVTNGALSVPAGCSARFTTAVGEDYNFVLNNATAGSLRFNDTLSMGVITNNTISGVMPGVNGTITVADAKTLTITNSGSRAANLALRVADVNYVGTYVSINAQSAESTASIPAGAFAIEPGCSARFTLACGESYQLTLTNAELANNTGLEFSATQNTQITGAIETLNNTAIIADVATQP